MIEKDIAWEALGDHLLHNAQRVWTMILKRAEADPIYKAALWGNLNDGVLALGTELLEEHEELSLPTYAFGFDGQDIAVHLIMPAIDIADGPLAYICIGWLEEQPGHEVKPVARIKPTLRVIPGGAT